MPKQQTPRRGAALDWTGDRQRNVVVHRQVITDLASRARDGGWDHGYTACAAWTLDYDLAFEDTGRLRLGLELERYLYSLGGDWTGLDRRRWSVGSGGIERLLDLGEQVLGLAIGG